MEQTEFTFSFFFTNSVAKMHSIYLSGQDFSDVLVYIFISVCIHCRDRFFSIPFPPQEPLRS